MIRLWVAFRVESAGGANKLTFCSELLLEGVDVVVEVIQLLVVVIDCLG